MSNNKYIKLGLRSDKNLSDLSNSDQGISNLLNNISGNLDEFGQKTGFTLADIEPLIGLRTTGDLIRNVIDETANGYTKGQSRDLAALSGSQVEFIVSTGTVLTAPPGDTLNIEPMVTMKDVIDNAKAILGDPPWLSGGDGPKCIFVSSDRINPDIITDAITGDSSTVAAEALSPTELFSQAGDQDYTEIVRDVDFWDNANFNFPNKLHPRLPDNFGLIQWEGYITEISQQYWESTGLFMIEEETGVGTGVYSKLKCVFAAENTIGYLTWTAAANVGDSFVVSPFNAAAKEAMRTYVCLGMKVTQGTTLIGTVTVVDNILGTCSVRADDATIAAASTSNVPGLKFSFVIGEQNGIGTAQFITRAQRLGDRSKLRYTLWYPTPPGAGDIYASKVFRENPDNSFVNLPYSLFYSTPGIQEIDAKYTYKYFHQNKGSMIKQRVDHDKNLRVNQLVRTSYVPQYELPKVLATPVAAEANGRHVLTTKQILIQENTGRLYCKDGWEECSIGDWVAFKINSSVSTTNYAVSYQIEELSGLYAFVDPTINDLYALQVGWFASNPAPIIAIVFKNAGLVGIFSNTRTMSLTENIIDGDELREGKRYRITQSSTGSPNFQTNAGSASNNVGTRFVATSTNGGNGKVVLEADSTASGNLWVTHSKADSLAVILVTAIVEGTSYKIIDLGTTTTQAQWHAAAGTTSGTDPDYKAGDTFIAAQSSPAGSGNGTVRASIKLPPIDLLNRDQTFFTTHFDSDGAIVQAPNFVVGTDYKITTLGSGTDWNVVAGTTGITYAVGHKFKAEIAGSGSGAAAAKPMLGLARAEKINEFKFVASATVVNAVVGDRYRIANIGASNSSDAQTDWNAVAGTTGSPLTYVAGDIITIAIQLGTNNDREFRKMSPVGEFIDQREITSQNYYENGGGSDLPSTPITSLYNGDSLSCLTAVYSDSGLDDQSESERCGGVLGRQVLSFAIEPFANALYTADAAAIRLDSVEGISTGDTIHHPAFNDNSALPAGKIDGINVALSTIYLKKTFLIGYDAATLAPGDTVAVVSTAVDSALTGDAIGKLYECIIPLDTAPPFNGTSTGLATPAGDDLELYNSALSFSELNLVINADKVYEFVAADAAPRTDSHFKIQHIEAGTATVKKYKMLIKE